MGWNDERGTGGHRLMTGRQGGIIIEATTRGIAYRDSHGTCTQSYQTRGLVEEGLSGSCLSVTLILTYLYSIYSFSVWVLFLQCSTSRQVKLGKYILLGMEISN